MVMLFEVWYSMSATVLHAWVEKSGAGRSSADPHTTVSFCPPAPANRIQVAGYSHAARPFLKPGRGIRSRRLTGSTSTDHRLGMVRRDRGRDGETVRGQETGGQV